MTAALTSVYNEHAALRTLDNPPARLPLPAALAQTLPFYSAEPLLEKLDKRLRACGESLHTVDRINIAWPHKHPDRKHRDAATGEAQLLHLALKKACPGIAFPMAAAIHETVHLGRSEDQSISHTLTGRQVYAVDAALQTEKLPFIERGHNRPEHFVIVDWTMAQGTTLANLASYLTHNGANVIAAIVPDYGDAPIAPRASCTRDALRSVFHYAACDLSGNYGPDECVDMFDAALQPHGRSLATLTHNEFKRLQNTVNADSKMFFSLLDDLGMDAAARRAFVQSRRGVRP